MSFDQDALKAAIAAHGRVARILVLDTAGSVPRGAGTSMLVWADPEQAGGQSGTIGGGALEYQAVLAARAALETGQDTLQRQPLGPNLAQCCGGAVTLLTELWDASRAAPLGPVIARPLPGSDAAQPLSVARTVAGLRNGAAPTAPFVQDGWVVEAATTPQSPLWIYGAGHVGRALVQVLHPLPDFAITWVDTGLDRFPDAIPNGVRALPAPDPARAVTLAPADAQHLILTYSHSLDLALCHALLSHGFASAGLIGSATKWARFRKRLRNLGHSDSAIDTITCPIGTPSLGKHPQAIAVGVASSLLSRNAMGGAACATPPETDDPRKAALG